MNIAAISSRGQWLDISLNTHCIATDYKFNGTEWHTDTDTYTHMRYWTMSSLVQVMICCLFVAKPWSEPMLVCCQLEPWEPISMKFKSILNTFHTRNTIEYVVYKIVAILSRPQCVTVNVQYIPRVMHQAKTWTNFKYRQYRSPWHAPECNFNWFRNRGAYMRHQTRPSLLQIMACRMLCTKPLSEPILDFCQLGPCDFFQWKLNQTTTIFTEEYARENVVCEMATILSRPKCVKGSSQ